MKKLPIRLRNMQPDDVNFILNSWLKSFRKAPSVRRMENNAYFHEQSKVIKGLLEKVNILIACDEKDSNNVYGYLVSQRIDNVFVIHYLYVKLSFRNMGIGKMLIRARDHELGEVAACYTHHTDTANRLAYKYKFMHNPFILNYYEKYVEGDIDYAAVEN
jgi:ribosomal protein S18 acetylase RimI-like enzyme